MTAGDRTTRRRGATLEAAILAAAWAELAEVGYQKLTFEAIAERAETSRAVLYRRWPTLAELVLAAMRRHAPMLSGDVPDTGVLRDDVLALLRRVSTGLARIGPETLYGLLADFFREPRLFADLQAQALTIGAEAMTAILTRAAERGELDLTAITPRIASLPVALLRHELFLNESLTTPAAPETAILEIVDDIFLPLVTGDGVVGDRL
jgi:AcrR family transcriptional regulator